MRDLDGAGDTSGKHGVKQLLVNDLFDHQWQRTAWHRPWLSLLVSIYPFAGFAGGIYCSLSGNWLFWPVGILLLAHTMTWAGLLSHDAMHLAIFRSRAWNLRVGGALTILSGACYFPFELLRDQHLEHHRHHAGVDGFSITRWISSLPAAVRGAVVACEWAYIPIATIYINVRNRVMPFRDSRLRHLAPRVAWVGILRALGFVALFSINPISVVLVFAAQLLTIHFMRLYDCFHHTFDIYPRHSEMPKVSRDYLQNNTFSSIFSRDAEWINAIFLHYGYHNAHHEKPHVPWHALPRLDRAMFDDRSVHCLLGRNLFRTYHRHRVTRLFRGLGRPRIDGDRLNTDEYWGIIMNITFLSYSP
jgi:fatty acid desaturase